MKCQNCDAPVAFADERCDRCGAKLLHRRVFPVSPKPEEFTLTAEDPPLEAESPSASEDWVFDTKPEFAPVAPGVVAPIAPIKEVRWGGFFRRAGAFLLDIVIILALTAVMGILAFIGYKVGLAAHRRAVSIDNAAPLVVFLTFGWIFLTAAYFVLFHGMDGSTIGKRLLGLRV
ncbi:MAG TPA: RDD family protein, partial [Candidatus Limnocylindria bacterium]|nr:RDD family protein [Candidatus Limnocylindria bacterium]